MDADVSYIINDRIIYKSVIESGLLYNILESSLVDYKKDGTMTTPDKDILISAITRIRYYFSYNIDLPLDVIEFLKRENKIIDQIPNYYVHNIEIMTWEKIISSYRHRKLNKILDE